MMNAKIKQILERELLSAKPRAGEILKIAEAIDDFISALDSEFKKEKIRAKAILGGSFRKGTLIRKEKYDADIFVQFDRKYENEDISEMLENALNVTAKKSRIKFEKIHGSRDYFSAKLKEIAGIPVFIEIVPVLEIRKASEARNITDVSLLHVSYILKKIKKSKKLADEIILLKTFCYALGCYGAESHIKGFSGYVLELLASNYGSFLKVLAAASKWNIKNKVIIDPERYYKGKKVLEELNESKLSSPIILIDPVQKERNTAAALSAEKLNDFISAAKKFLKNPSASFFAKKEISEEKMRKYAKGRKAIFFRASAASSKHSIVAGAKLLKFFNLLASALEKESYKILKKEWNYDERKKKAKFFFVLKKPKQVLIKGPPVSMKIHAEAFKKGKKGIKIVKGIIYAVSRPKEIAEILKVRKNVLDEMGVQNYSNI